MVDNAMPGAWPVWTPGAPLAAFIRAVAGQHSSPDLCFATKLIKIYDP